MADSIWFRVEGGKWKLTTEGATALRLRLSTAPAESFGDEFGVSRSACYLWLKGAAISARGRTAVLKLLGEPEMAMTKRLEDYSIEELVAALKAKGVRDVQFTM